MTIRDVIRIIEGFAPRSLQEEYDNCGVQVGEVNQPLTAALICIDVSEEILREAISLSANLIISHHPLLFKGIKSLTPDTAKNRIVMEAIRHNIVIYAAHTNLDNAWGGVSFQLANRLNLKAQKILSPQQNTLFVLHTFVPIEEADDVRCALLDIGAGSIGNYDQCSYNNTGVGTYRALKGAHPTCGSIGEIHNEEEIQIQVLVQKHQLPDVVSALLQSHPYEEPVYNIYPITNRNPKAGGGVIGELETEMCESDFLRLIKEKMDVSVLRHSVCKGRKIRRVALCGGSGASFIPVAIAQKADAIITAELSYHDFEGYQEQLLLVDAGHYETEQYTKELICAIIRKKITNFAFHISKIEKNPINYL